jgi:hypothetical protein
MFTVKMLTLRRSCMCKNQFLDQQFGGSTNGADQATRHE